MSSARGNNKEVFINPYALQREVQCARIRKKLDSLNIPSMDEIIPPIQHRKRTKKTQDTREVPTNNHNLRPRPERTIIETAASNEDILDCETVGDFLNDNEVADTHSNSKKKRKGRGISKMDDILLRAPNQPEIKIELNELGQRVGDNGRKLSSVIGIQLRKILPLGYADWRLVDAEKKLELWNDIKKRFDIDDAALDWFMASAGAKWKHFNANLKRQYFDESLTDEQLMNMNGHRIDDDEWNALIKYWRSPESQALAARGKDNRAKLKFLHTLGSVSYACAAHKMAEQLGRPARRDEVYIKTHTRKNGVPLGPSADTIDLLKDIVHVYPELMDKTIQQGDAFATVCGEKEPRGRVRVLGLGPTPQDIGTPGLKAYTSTRLQIQVLAHQKAKSENLVLQQRILEMQEREEQRMAQEFPNVETSQHGSNSRQHMSPRYEELGEANHHVQGDECDNYADEENYVEEPIDEANQHVASPAISPAMNITTSPSNDDDSHLFSQSALVGNEVILFTMSGTEKVAKAIVVSVNPNNKLGGEVLGTRYCEVIVNVVLKRETYLPRPYAEIKTLGDALKMPIAWPYNRLKVCSKQQRSEGVVAGSSQGSSQGAAGSSQRR